MMALSRESLFIITQERDYFLSHKKFKFILLKKSEVKKLKKLNINKITFLLYDYLNSKIYGIYKIDLNNFKEKDKEKKYFYYSLITSSNTFRRAVYYFDKTKHKDFSISQAEESVFEKLKTKLIIMNGDIVKIFLSVKIKNDVLIYKSIATEPEFYEITRRVNFSKEAYQNIYKKYKELISLSGSEKNKKENYISLGREMCNMLMPHVDFKQYLFSSYKIVFLSLDEEALKIPWEILSFNGVLFSSVLTFSYSYSKNIPASNNKKNIYSVKAVNVNQKKKKNKLSVAVVKIKYIDTEEIDKNDNEVFAIKNLENDFVNIDVCIGCFDYTEIIAFFEKYDVIHIIAHGAVGGIRLKDDFVLLNVNSLENPPILIFLNSCSEVKNGDKLIDSLIDSGVKTVISGVGKIADNYSYNFALTFYENIFNENFRINTAMAFYFASIECDDFLRYRFNGETTVL